MIEESFSIVWTDYVRYRAELRGFEIQEIEGIVRYTSERYFDTRTLRKIAVGRHDSRLVMIPYEENKQEMIPVTIHATSRQQINFRLKTGRFKHGKNTDEIFRK